MSMALMGTAQITEKIINSSKIYKLYRDTVLVTDSINLKSLNNKKFHHDSCHSNMISVSEQAMFTSSKQKCILLR